MRIHVFYSEDNTKITKGKNPVEIPKMLRMVVDFMSEVGAESRLIKIHVVERNF